MTSVLGLSLQGGIACVLILLMCAAFTVADTGQASDTASGDEVRRGMPMRPSGKSRTQLFFERIAKTVQPDLVGSADKLDIYLTQFKALALNDKRMIAFDVQAKWDTKGSAVTLTGFVEYEEHRVALANYLGVLGFTKIDDRTEVMPTNDLGDTPFAVVTDAAAFVYESPDDRSETVTQMKQSDAFFLLRPAADGFYHCHASDGYVGYVKSDQVKRVTADEFAKTLGPAPTEKTEPAIQAADAIKGTPYLWGGTTPTGIDCSGLTRYAYEHIGVLLSRDTDQQAAMGTLTATRAHRQAMQRGDLIFFFNSRGRINHTAIYLGDGQFLESGGPGVRISSLNPDHDNYIEKRDQGFAFAKRIVK